MTKKTKSNSPSVDTRSFWERNEASNGILLNETIKKYVLSIFRAILLFGMCFMIIQPLLNKLAVSFMAEQDLYDTTITLIPKHFSLSNWKIAINLLNYKSTLINTIINKTTYNGNIIGSFIDIRKFYGGIKLYSKNLYSFIMK